MRHLLKIVITLFLAIWCFGGPLYGQEDTANKKPEKWRKNIIRYNLSGGMLFGLGDYVVVGYERVVNARQSFSINIGPSALPKLTGFTTDSFSLQRDLKNNGFNVSVDYRFYLGKENKYAPPHGLYIGPYTSYNHFHRNNQWSYQKTGSQQQLVGTETSFNIYTIGVELGYQFILWKRVALDFLMVGPGLGNYDLTTKITSDLTDAQKQRLQKAVKELITQKFPGMNYVFSDKEFKANGSLKTWTFGYRYIIHLGFVF